MTESLIEARKKLARVIEIYAPGHPNVRPAALEAWGAALLEYEAAVREDERAISAAAITKAQAQVLEVQARAVSERLPTVTPAFEGVLSENVRDEVAGE